MTDHQLQQLAREYATYMAKSNDWNVDKEWILFREAQPLLRWLSARYCIVEKSTITQMYSANKRLMDEYPVSIIYNESLMVNRMLEVIFGKELFNETGK